MSVSTHTAYQTKNTIVTIRGGCAERMTFEFSTRHDAAVFLAAMRKRVRR